MPLTGLVAIAPVNTPVFSFARSVRSRSLLRRATSWYAATAARCSGVVSSATSACSGDSTMYVAPYSVSGRVVNTRSSRPATGVAVVNVTSAPSLRPIQFRCIATVDAGQSTVSRSASNRSA